MKIRYGKKYRCLVKYMGPALCSKDECINTDDIITPLLVFGYKDSIDKIGFKETNVLIPIVTFLSCFEEAE